MHPEADALLDAIFDHPDDDTPRLVYADWLQEHDYEDYAQFIRLSIRADGGSKPPAERKRLRSERQPFWHRIEAVRHNAFRHIPVTIHDFERGLCNAVTVHGDTFLRTIESWWPAITPRELTVYGMRGFGERSIETEVVAAIGKYLPWLRKLRCYCRPGMDVHDIDEYGFPPLDGSVFTALAAPGALPRLRSLDVTIVWAIIPALRAFAASALPGQLNAAYLRFQLPATRDFERITVTEADSPGAFQRELEMFLKDHG